MVWMNVVTADETARMLDESARHIFLCAKDILTMYLGTSTIS